jgi:peptide/nickel transport system permease protein
MAGGTSWLSRAADSDIWWSFKSSSLTVIAAVVTFLIVAIAFLSPLLAPHTPFDPGSLSLSDGLKPPAWMTDGDWSFVIGTDDQGRDVLSSIMYGTRLSLVVGLASVIVSMLIGITLGLVSGYVGGATDAVIMRIADVQLTFPAILVALLIDGVVRGLISVQKHDEIALFVIIGAIGLSFWVQYARTVRGSVLVEKNKEYVQAARVIGCRRS